MEHVVTFKILAGRGLGGKVRDGILPLDRWAAVSHLMRVGERTVATMATMATVATVPAHVVTRTVGERLHPFDTRGQAVRCRFESIMEGMLRKQMHGS